MYDVIIIGAGPAGLTAGIYTSRRGMKSLIISKGFSNQVTSTNKIHNYPGYLEIKGFELIQKMEEQARNSGAEIILEEVEKIKEKGKNFIVKSNQNEYECKTLILAFGKTPRNLNVPGEKELTGKGISYCVTCDGPLFKDRIVVVVGGGNSALDAASYMAEIAKKVYLIHRREEFRGFESMVAEIKKYDNVEFVLNSVVVEFKGDKFLKYLIVENVNNKKRKELQVDGCFIEIGSEVKTDFIKGLVKTDENNHIIINSNCETSHPGIFAAGDVTNTPFKQIVVAAGEGAKAALNAYNYLHGIKSAIIVDWKKGK